MVLMEEKVFDFIWSHLLKIKKIFISFSKIINFPWSVIAIFASDSTLVAAINGSLNVDYFVLFFLLLGLTMVYLVDLEGERGD